MLNNLYYQKGYFIYIYIYIYAYIVKRLSTILDKDLGKNKKRGPESGKHKTK